MCKSAACRRIFDSPKTLKAQSKLSQRACREATGYFCGYVFKGQPVGRKWLKGAARSLNYMTVGLQDKTEGQRWHRITHRVLQDLQHRCMVRTAPEEWNLAANWHEQDPTAAEFLRTYRSEYFPGGLLVHRLEAEKRRVDDRSCNKVVPVMPDRDPTGPVFLKSFDDLYGHRGGRD
jgi:hypothetical protein